MIAEIQAKFPEATQRPSGDFEAFDIPAGRLLAFLEFLRDSLGFKFLCDITAVDWGMDAPVRFSGVYHLSNPDTHQYVRVVAACADNAAPALPSASALWPAADWHERETWDLLGVRFTGHPDLRRILMWEGYPYHPLRKDFPLAGIETELPAEDVAERTGVKVIPAPEAGGPFTACTGGSSAHNEPCAKDQSWNEQNPKPNDLGQPSRG